MEANDPAIGEQFARRHDSEPAPWLVGDIRQAAMGMERQRTLDFLRMTPDECVETKFAQRTGACGRRALLSVDIGTRRSAALRAL